MAGGSVAPFGELLRQHRLAAGLTPEALAQRARLHPESWNAASPVPTATPPTG